MKKGGADENAGEILRGDDEEDGWGEGVSSDCVA